MKTHPGNTSKEKNIIDQQIKALTISDPDLQAESQSIEVSVASTNPRSKKEKTTGATDTARSTTTYPYCFVPLRMGGNGRTHIATDESASLLPEIGSLRGLEAMTERFYDKAFADETLDKFIRSKNDPHGHRFATWVHQKLGGPGRLWDEERSTRSNKPVRVAGGQYTVVHDRSSAHVAAWHSPKRPTEEVGRHFKLDECRVWMRLHFWAMREAGLIELSPSFCDYYVRFIEHFVNVYEGTAPMFARESFRWSADPKNIQKYLDNGRKMTDVLGLSLKQAMRQLPPDEANDAEWPYIDSPEQRDTEAW